jgi:hypothetical protein
MPVTIPTLKTITNGILSGYPSDLPEFSRHQYKELVMEDDGVRLMFQINGTRRKFSVEIYPTADEDELCFYVPEYDFLSTTPIPANSRGEAVKTAAETFLKNLRNHASLFASSPMKRPRFGF